MNDEIPSIRHFPIQAAIFEGSLVVVAVGLGWLVGQPPLETFRLSAVDVGWGVAATGPLLAMFWLCLKCPLPPFRRIVRVIDELLTPLFAGCGWGELAVISLLAGLGEEMLFRGVIQRAIENWVGPPSGVYIGLIGAAVLFGLAHFITLTYALLAGLIGLYLGWLFNETDNLLVPIFAHAVYDFIALVYLVRMRGSKTLQDTVETTPGRAEHDETQE